MTLTAARARRSGAACNNAGRAFQFLPNQVNRITLSSRKETAAASSGFEAPRSGEAFAAQIPAPEHKCSASQREEVKDRGLLACEHQRGACACQRGLADGARLRSAPTGQNQSKRGGDKKGFMNEVSVVVDGQRSDGKQQRGEQAGHEAEHFDRRAKKENRDSSGDDRCQAQFRFRQVRE